MTINKLILLFIACTLYISCKQNQYPKIDSEVLTIKWRKDILDAKKTCRKYIGSKKNAADRKIVVAVMDSLLGQERIVKSLNLFNWIDHSTPSNPYDFHRKPIFYIISNREQAYKIALDNQTKNYSVNTISYDKSLSIIEEIKRYKSSLEYSDIDYKIDPVDGTLELINSEVYCSKD